MNKMTLNILKTKVKDITGINLDSLVDTVYSHGVNDERERILQIIRLEHYMLEEWYSSADKPKMIGYFEANQRNITTRNVIIDKIKHDSDFIK